MYKPSAHTAYIAYSSYPNAKREEYIQAMNKIYNRIQTKRKLILNIQDNSYDYNYNPIHYHLWGTWSLLTFCFTDDSHLITKNIHPDFMEKTENGPDELTLGFVNTKTITGLLFDGVGVNPNDFLIIKDAHKFPFVASTNLTISKKWIIPNGYTLMQKIIEKINEILSDDKYLLINSFSSYEICLTIFGKSLKHLANKINLIRELTCEKAQIPVTQFNTLQDPIDGKEKSNIFSDSISYFGIRYLAETKKCVDAVPDVAAKFEIECRPSKTNKVVNILKEHNISVRFKPGKYDITCHFKNYYFDHTITDKLRKNYEFVNSIRKFKTVLLFSQFSNTSLESSSRPQNKTPKHLRSFLQCNFDYVKINENLKKIKIAKSLRYQILKMFFTYKNVVSEPISYSYFYDLMYFVKDLEKQIENDANVIDQRLSISGTINLGEKNYSVAEREEVYKELLEIFEETFFVRYVNDHSLEDVPDFLIRQSGGQMQSLVTAYDNFAKYLSNEILGNKYYKLVTSFDDTVLEINKYHLKISTNYLFEPANAIFILLKEIYNIYMRGKSNALDLQYIQNEYNKLLNEYLLNYITDNIYLYKEQLKIIDITYTINDYVRLKYYFQSDFKLFYYMHLSNFLMNTSSYYSSGSLHRGKLFRELNRMMALAKIIQTDLNDAVNLLEYIKDNPPNIESKLDWQRYYNDTINWIESDQFSLLINLWWTLGENVGKNLNITTRYKILDTDVIYNNLTNSRDISDFKQIWDFLYLFMNEIKPKDKAIPSLLARKWSDGEGLKVDKKNKLINQYTVQNDSPNSLFLVDPQGGIYFNKYPQMIKYTKTRNKLLLILMHLSSLYKKEMYSDFNMKYNANRSAK